MTARFDAKAAERILQRIADGSTLNAACLAEGVARRSARDWVVSEPAFATALAEARRQCLEVLADEVLSIGDAVEGSNNPAAVNAARVRIDLRKWLLSKLNPERYGEKVELTGTGGRDLISSEVAIPRLMAVLSVVLGPTATNSELHELATTMAGKLKQLDVVEHARSDGLEAPNGRETD